MSILFISSELPEVLRVSDRIVVMRDRKAGGEYRAVRSTKPPCCK
jgi:simple sugar transport system ATP-binding protein